MNISKRYVERVFKSINKNLSSLEENAETLQGVLETINQFYKSLFANDTGFFGRKNMDKKLAKVPDVLALRIERRQDSATAAEQEIAQGERNKGLGKGRPGCVRKPKVTQRQERRRGEPDFTSRKRKSSSDKSAGKQPPKKIAPRPPSTTSGPPSSAVPALPSSQSVDTTSAAPTTSSNTGGETSASVMDEAAVPNRVPEARQPLRAQRIEQFSNKTQVQLIQNCAKATKDQPPTCQELELFWNVMDDWKTLNPHLVNALRHLWSEISHDVDTPLLEKIFELARMSNGLNNCTHHLIGNLVRHFASKNDEQNRTNTTAICEALEDKLKELHYQYYNEALLKCACDSCTQVIEFDEDYSRYHDNLESENREEWNESVPSFEERPPHCGKTELIAQTLRTQFTGLSSSNLLKWYYFANTTPVFSPPSICLAPPTSVLTTTLKYMEPYLRERKLQDALPSSWKIPKANVASGAHYLQRVPKERLHIYDADSGEITLLPGEPDLEKLATHKNTIRFRMLNSDSPETEHSVRIYKEPEETTVKAPFLTRHIGIESLRAARQMLFEAKEVYFQIEMDLDGKPSKSLDPYKRMLVNIFLENADGEKQNFAEKLAFNGFTLSFYSTGVDIAINSAMRRAIEGKKGIFNLPEEAFTYPFRPWDVRKLNKKGKDATYLDYTEILNRPSDPAVAWKPPQNVATAVGNGESDDTPESESTDNFYLRLVPSTLYWESKCFVAKSSIPDAGRGLFLKPHETIPADSHLCLYAEHSTTLEEIEANNSSRAYAIFSSKKKLWFDAEIETGNNIGRFANQPGVLQALDEIKQLSTKDKPHVTEDDWRSIERRLDDLCNARFDVVANQMVLKAKQHLENTYDPATEIFVNYGGLRDYWIPLLIEHESDEIFPTKMIEIMRWLLRSEECNWTTEQRKKWT